MAKLSLNFVFRVVLAGAVLLCFLGRKAVSAAAEVADQHVAVISVEPKYIIKSNTAVLTAQLNSTDCGFLSDEKSKSIPTIQIKGAFQNGSDAVYHGQATHNCSKFLFKLNATNLQQGSYGVSVSVLDQDLPVLQPKVEVMDFPTVAISGPPQLEQSGNLDMLVTVPVIISEASPLDISVDLVASDNSSIEVLTSPISWEANQTGKREFQARLKRIPPDNTLTLVLVDPINCIVDAHAAKAELVVRESELPVPIFEYKTNQAVYRGEQPQLQLMVRNSISPNKSTIKYFTSVRSAAGDTLDDSTARESLRTSGVVTIDPGQTTIPPINLTLDWDEVPDEAEYRVLVLLDVVRNAQVENQWQEVALFVYGVEEDMCPPGTSVAVNSTGTALPSFSKDAGLQDLFMEVCCDNDNRAPYTVSLSPAFTPGVATYSAYIPFGRQYVDLSLFLSQPSDVVTIVSVNCTHTNSTVINDPSISAADRKPQTRGRLRVGVEPSPCALNITVEQPESKAGVAKRRKNNNGAGSAALVAAGGSGGAYSMVASYQVLILPLVNPELMRLKAISLVNSTTQLVLCGDPSPVAETTPITAAASSEDGGDADLTPASDGDESVAVAASSAGEAGLQLQPIKVVRTLYTLKSCNPSECMFINATDIGPSTRITPEAFTPETGGIDFVNTPATFTLAPASASPSGFAKVPITLMANDSVSSKTYEVVVLTLVPTPYPEPAALEATFYVSCAADSSFLNATPISSQATTVSSSTAKEAQERQGYVFKTRDPSYPQHPAASPNCSVCANGSYSSRANADKCQLCPPGQYATVLQWPTPLPTACQDCRPGTYTYSWGSASCLPCFPGTYASNSGSLYCSICPDKFTTAFKGATNCPVSVSAAAMYGSSQYADVVSFGVLLNGTTWDKLVNLTGINASSVTILSLLIRTDVAAFVNVTIDAVHVTGSRFISRRALLLNVSATVPYSPDVNAAASTQQLSADELVLKLNQDPDVIFMRTAKMTGASVSVTGVTKGRKRIRGRHARDALLVHIILWPTLIGAFMVCGGGFWACKRCRRKRRHGPLILDSQHCLRWMRGSPSSSQGSDRSEMELQELAMNSISSPPRQRGSKQPMMDSAYDRFYEPHEGFRKA